MDAVVRAWLGFLALGAGLIHLALVIGAPPAVAVPLIVVGVAEVGWGVFAFTAARIPVPRAARIAALVPLLAWVVVLLGGDTAGLGLRALPMLVASLFDLAIAIGITAVLRRTTAAPRPIGAARYLLSLGAGALVVAALTTPALAATQAGEFAVPHGDLPGPHSGH